MDAESKRKTIAARKEALRQRKLALQKAREKRQNILKRTQQENKNRAHKSHTVNKDIKNFIEVTTQKSKPKVVATEETGVASQPIIENAGKLQLIQGDSVNIEPIDKEREMYEKSIQVDTLDIASFIGMVNPLDPPEVQEKVNLTSLGTSTLHPIDVTKENIVTYVDDESDNEGSEGDENKDESMHDEDYESSEGPNQAIPKMQAVEHVECLTGQARRDVLGQQEFVDFFTRTSLLVERCLALNGEVDLFADFSKEDTGNRETAIKVVIKKRKVFALEETNDRPITCISRSKLKPELFLATYAAPLEASLEQPDGLLLVWNVLLNNRTEYAFESQSMITVADFHPSKPNQILGCTLSGQVLLWDMRENKRTPIFRSQYVSSATHPIFAMSFLPSSAMAMEQILTVSHEAKICVWRDDMLSEPHEMLFKVGEATRAAGGDELTTACFSVYSRDTNNIILGSDTGHLYGGTVYHDSNPQTCTDIPAHTGPITNIEFHPPHEKLTPENLLLFLTSSYDWTIKLWDKKTDMELATFDVMQDYIHDVRWSPAHPAVFACVDGMGQCTIFSLLNKDFTQPVCEIQIAECGICRLCWSEDGKQIIFADANGEAHLYDVAEELYTWTDEDILDLQSCLTKLTKDAEQKKVEDEQRKAEQQYNVTSRRTAMH